MHSASAYLEKPLRKRDLGADAASAPAASRKGKEVDRSHAALDNAATKWNSMPTARLSKKQAKAVRALCHLLLAAQPDAHAGQAAYSRLCMVRYAGPRSDARDEARGPSHASDWRP
jgi:hypothetical protein